MRWEYKRFLIPYWLGPENKEADKELNELGREEWEVFFIEQAGLDGKELVAFAKRPYRPKFTEEDMKTFIANLSKKVVAQQNK